MSISRIFWMIKNITWGWNRLKWPNPNQLSQNHQIPSTSSLLYIHDDFLQSQRFKARKFTIRWEKQYTSSGLRDGIIASGGFHAGNQLWVCIENSFWLWRYGFALFSIKKTYVVCTCKTFLNPSRAVYFLPACSPGWIFFLQFCTKSVLFSGGL